MPAHSSTSGSRTSARPTRSGRRRGPNSLPSPTTMAAKSGPTSAPRWPLDRGRPDDIKAGRVLGLAHGAPCVLAGDDGAVLAAIDHLVAVDVVDDTGVLVLYVDAHVTLLMGPAPCDGGSTGKSR